MTALIPAHRAETASEAPLSEAQRLFNSLTRKIEERRAKLGAWETASTQFHQRFLSELAPLIEGTLRLQARMAKTLDEAHTQPGLSPADREALSFVVVELCESLLGKTDDAEIMAIYQRHVAGPSVSPEEDMDIAKAIAREMFGVDLGNESFSSVDEALDRAREKMEQERARQAEKKRNREQRRAEQKAKKPQTAQQAAAQALSEERESRKALSLREVYRRLASALHPDREPDEAERARKTILMQRANQAYAKGNLHELLRMQLEVARVDREHISRLGDEKLSIYCQLLQDELQSLDRQMQEDKNSFRDRYGIAAHVKIDPRSLHGILSADVNAHKRTHSAMEKDLGALGDPKGFRAWLRALRR